jgi:hypothetical protein
LQLLYPGKYSLNITENEMSYNVTMKIALHIPDENGIQVSDLKEKVIYELA